MTLHPVQFAKPLELPDGKEILTLQPWLYELFEADGHDMRGYMPLIAVPPKSGVPTTKGDAIMSQSTFKQQQSTLWGCTIAILMALSGFQLAALLTASLAFLSLEVEAIVERAFSDFWNTIRLLVALSSWVPVAFVLYQLIIKGF